MRGLRRYVGRRMIVQVADQTLDGTVQAVERDTLVLVKTSLMNQTSSVPLDGEVAIPTGGISWVQVV